MTTGISYFEEAIAAAQTVGDVEPGNAALKARSLMSYYEGVLTQARIENNPESIRHLATDVLELIGVRPVLAAA